MARTQKQQWKQRRLHGDVLTNLQVVSLAGCNKKMRTVDGQEEQHKDKKVGTQAGKKLQRRRRGEGGREERHLIHSEAEETPLAGLAVRSRPGLVRRLILIARLQGAFFPRRCRQIGDARGHTKAVPCRALAPRLFTYDPLSPRVLPPPCDAEVWL